MDSVKWILGEDETERPETEPAETAVPPPARQEDRESEELANLWTTGNKGEVAQRFLEMDNESSVRLVFAIGIDGAVELARMVDQMVKQKENPEPGESAEASTEPQHVEQAEEEPGYPEQILGRKFFSQLDPSA